MKSNPLCYSLFFILLLITNTNAQTLTGNDAQSLVSGSTEVRIDLRRKTVSFIQMNESAKVQEGDANWLRHALKAEINTSFSLEKRESDELGFTHFRYSQKYHGLKVEYGRYYVHCKNSVVVSANGEYYDVKNVGTQPAISKKAALESALRIMNSNQLRDDINSILNNSEIVILPYNDKFYCAFKFDIYSISPLKRAYVYVNGMTGEVITEVNRIHTGDAQGTAVSAYNGTVPMTTDSISANSFRLRALKGFSGFRTLNMNFGSNYGSATDFTDTDNNWNTTGLDKYATDAHFGAEATFDWFLSRFGRNSFDNAGAQINSYVHYSTNFVNAFWDGTQFTYGDGDGIDFTPLTSLDIVGHEIMHAVTEHTAGLVYSNESGALNESYSDCIGITVDFYKNPTTANFLEGDQINVNGIPFRNMSNPNQFDDPDTYHGDFWDPFEEVHTNSGVMNFWYYLICTGGSGTNDNGDNYTVNSITMTKASAIIYRALTVYLTPNSNYADMRDASVQSAIDLYGNCSNEVIQVTNAWYAVGVGGLFSNAVVAGFSASQNFLCVVPASVSFTNTSINGLTFSWNFGDGGTSTAANPTHSYLTAGTYTVTLIANGSASCSSGDTLQIVNYITVTNGGGPTSASCLPATISYCCGIGITNVQFNTINNTSVDAVEGYKDFTCANSTTIVAGDPVQLSVTTGTTYSENVKAWIDYNNDGSFNNTTEQVFTSSNHLLIHSGVVQTSSTAVLNTALRMRITDDEYSNSIGTGCYSPIQGQTEDYTVTFVANTQRPIADFTANVLTVNVGGTVNFTDLSIHVPTSWTWTFTGGTPSSSTQRNPSVQYNTLGTYAVKLKVTNTFGTDSITKTAYINVVNSVSLCSGITSTTAANGQFYDSGGPTGSYMDNENCSLLVDPGCAISITLTFTQFSTEGCCDHLYIYNGTNTSAPLLADLYGSMIPSPVTASSGKMFIVWHSDPSATYPGWQAAWTSVLGTGLPPVAAFTPGTANPPLGVDVQFTDGTTNLPNAWSWDFGDGGGSILQNPLHAYSTSGSKTVRLISSNCITSDTVTHVINVQTAPVITVNPDTVTQTLNCNDSIVVPITITNSGTGDGVYYLEGTSSATDTVKVLAVMEGVDLSQEYPNTISAISMYFNRYTVTQFISTSPTLLQSALTDKDVLLFPEQEIGNTSFYSALAPVVQDFVNNGGRVIVLGSASGSENRMYAMGLFTGSYLNYASSQTVQVHDTTDELTNNCQLTFICPSGTFYHNITNTDKVELASLSSNDILSYRDIGSGKAIYLGFDYYSIENNAARMLANAISSTTSSASWIRINQITDTISPGTSQTIYVTLVSTGLSAGLHQQQVQLQSNDPLNPVITINFDLTVVGPAEIALSDTCLSYGTITQFTTRKDTIEIFNNGCDTLHLTSINSSNSAFIPSVTSLNIPPGDSENLIISFNPQSIGSFNAVLTILNNSNDTTICLTGSAGAAPVIDFSPRTLTANLNSCSDSIIIPVYIHNIGGSDLNFDIIGGGSGDTVRILAYIFGSDLVEEYPNTINAISTYFDKFTVDTTKTENPTYLQNKLTDKDVLLFIEQESGSTMHYTNFATVVQNFVSAGGTVVVCGATNAANQIYSMGLFAGTYQSYVNSGTGMVSDTTDDLMDGVPLSIALTNSTIYHGITNSDKTELLTYNGYDVVTYRPIGAGRVIYVGWDFYDSNLNTERIISNCIRYVDNISLANWIDLSVLSGTVVPGDSMLVNITVNSSGLSGGTYNTYIIVESNDPLHPIDSIPVSITVGYNPCAQIGMNGISSCSGIVSFRDSSVNNPTSWNWDFGDGSTSTLENPQHTYSTAGTYLVKLLVCNGLGCDSTTRSIQIISANGPVIPSCMGPLTNAYCCGIGIVHVTFNTISKTSSDGIAGYEDFTCTSSTTVNQGQVYLLSVTTGLSYPENTIAWIDYNGDGNFVSTEQVMYSMNTYQNHTSNVTIPNNTSVNTPLRMRIVSESSSSPLPNSCNSVEFGQFEDYTVMIIPNTLPPNAQATHYVTNYCSGEVNFTDLTVNNPTSWNWNFGDGQTSTQQNPVHTYASSGTYSVTLTATNQYGSDSYSLSVTVQVINQGITVTGIQMIHQVLQFTTPGSGFVTYLWNFGDGYLASIQNPVHTYSIPGVYVVSLTVTSGGCSATLYDTLNIINVGVDEIDGITSFNVFPNPFDDEVKISYSLAAPKTVSLQVFDLMGNIVQSLATDQLQNPGDYNYKLNDLSQSVYFVRLILDDKSSVFKLIRMH